MKHNLKITFILLAIFLLAQFIGIAVLYNYIDQEKTDETGTTQFKELPIGERPPIEEKTSFIWLGLAVLLGTGLLLLLIKFKAYTIWRFWFLIAVTLSLIVSFTAFIKPVIALILALILGIWKIYKPNIIIHNLTEVFIYGGLAAIFVPLFNLWSIIILLLLISIYDAYAVWKSKHMITLAKSQAKAKVFAGLLIPYKLGKLTKSKKVPQKKIRTAILGGGDIGFPLIFTGVVLKNLGLWQALIIPLFSGAALLLLLYFGKEKKFYPAMPFITAGCLLGLAIVSLF